MKTLITFHCYIDYVEVFLQTQSLLSRVSCLVQWWFADTKRWVGAGAQFIAWLSCVFTVLVKSAAVGWPETCDQSWLFKHFITC